MPSVMKWKCNWCGKLLERLNTVGKNEHLKPGSRITCAGTGFSRVTVKTEKVGGRDVDTVTEYDPTAALAQPCVQPVHGETVGDVKTVIPVREHGAGSGHGLHGAANGSDL